MGMGWMDGERSRRIEHVGLAKPERALLMSALEAAGSGGPDPVLGCRGAPLRQCEVLGRVISGAKKAGADPQGTAWRCAKALDELCALSLEGGWIHEEGSDWADRDPAAHALYSDMPRLALFLVDRGASADAQMHDGDPLVVWFARARPEHLLEFLDRAPELNARGRRGGSFLHHLAWSERVPARAPLSLYRAAIAKAKAMRFDIDARDHGGRSPLHWAAQAGGRDLAQALVEAGADPLAVDARGLAPWEDAGAEAVAEYLEAAALASREDKELRGIDRDREELAGRAALELIRQGRVVIDGKAARSLSDLLDARARAATRPAAKAERGKGRL